MVSGKVTLIDHYFGREDYPYWSVDRKDHHHGWPYSLVGGDDYLYWMVGDKVTLIDRLVVKIILINELAVKITLID